MSRFRFSLISFFLIFPMFLMAHDVSSSDQSILDGGGLLAYIYVGAKHMLTGYDHLLFLVGVIFYLTGLKDILTFITAFTIGHSITLLGATHMELQVNEHLIDAIIALSVLYKGFENLGGFEKVFRVKPPNLLFMVFAFGLFHGLGLSTRLQSFDVGNEHFLSKIVCFNIGVELGQVLALIPIVFLITLWKSKKSYNAFYKAANSYLILAGLVLFMYQMYGYFMEH